MGNRAESRVQSHVIGGIISVQAARWTGEAQIRERSRRQGDTGRRLVALTAAIEVAEILPEDLDTVDGHREFIGTHDAGIGFIFPAVDHAQQEVDVDAGVIGQVGQRQLRCCLRSIGLNGTATRRVVQKVPGKHVGRRPQPREPLHRLGCREPGEFVVRPGSEIGRKGDDCCHVSLAADDHVVDQHQGLLGKKTVDQIVARTTLEPIGSTTAIDRISGSLPLDDIVAVAGLGWIRMVAVELVPATAAVETVVAGRTLECVVSAPATHAIVAGVAEQDVVGRPAVEAVVTGTAVQVVRAALAFQGVVADTAVKIVGCATTNQHVVAALAVDEILSGFAIEQIGTVVAVQYVTGVTAHDSVIPVATIDRVTTIVSLQAVGTVSATDKITTVTGIDRVGTLLRKDAVAAVASVDDIVASTPLDAVVSVTAQDRVSKSGTAVDRVVAVVTLDRHLHHGTGDRIDVVKVAAVDEPQVNQVRRIATGDVDRLNVACVNRRQARIRNTVDVDLDIARRIGRDPDAVAGIGNDRQFTVDEQRRHRQQRPVLKPFGHRRSRNLATRHLPPATTLSA